MPDILSQVLEVSFISATKDHPQAGLLYKLRPLIDPSTAIHHRHQPPVLKWFVRVPSTEWFCSATGSPQEMIWRLINGTPCKNEFDETIRRLAGEILPPGGFAGIFGEEFHPQLDVRDEKTSRIPWEFLEECHWVCPEGHVISEVLPSPPKRVCPGCNREMRIVAGEQSVAQYVCHACGNEYDLTEPPMCHYCNTVMQEDKPAALTWATQTTQAPLTSYRCLRCDSKTDGLKTQYCRTCGKPMAFRIIFVATKYHMTHCPDVERTNPLSEGDRFLFVGDPDGTLCNESKDPDRTCRDHLERLHAIIEGQGFVLDSLPGVSATREKVLGKISDHRVLGGYFFCHGGYDDETQQSFLELSDGKLYAADIQKASPRLAFTFLNACHSGSMHVNVGAERFNRSVAQAFVCEGPGRTLIAPICPVVNTDAARMAVEFFGRAVAGKSLGEALRETRRLSSGRYNGTAESDISWMAYRYYGDPNRCMFRSRPAINRDSRVFDAQGNLNHDVFSFNMAAALVRAAKRRNHQARKLATATDIVAGLVRVGELTRYILTERGFNPDKLYERFGETREEGQRKSPDLLNTYEQLARDDLDGREQKKLWRRVIQDWMLENRADFTEEAIAMLTAADAAAESVDSSDHRISEETLLRVILDSGLWPSNLIQCLPGAEEIWPMLDRREQSQQVDANGSILLDGLTPAAKKGIENAHSVALRGRVCPIPNRALLAGMTTDLDSYGAQVFECIGIAPRFVCSLMKASVGDKETNSDSFGLSPHACSRIITPALERAREIAALRGDGPVTEADLFKSFWLTCDVQFKHGLGECLQIDPDRLTLIDPRDPDCTAGRISTRHPDFDESLFDQSVWRMLTIATNIALVQNSPSVRMPHLFVGMTSTGKVAREFLLQYKLDRDLLDLLVLSAIPRQPSQSGVEDALGLSENVRRVLTYAVEMARTEHRVRCTELDLFKAFFTEGGSVVGQILGPLGIAGPIRLLAEKKEEKHYLSLLEEEFSAKVVGQSTAIRALQVSLGEDLCVSDGPWRVFAFVGPVGAGRGIVSRILGRWFSGSDSGTLSVDLSEEGPDTLHIQNGISNTIRVENELRDQIARWLESRPCSVLEFRATDRMRGPTLELVTKLLREGIIERADGQVVCAKRAIVVLSFDVSSQLLERAIFNASVTGDSPQSLQDVLCDAVADRIPERLRECLNALIPFRRLDATDLTIIAERAATRFSRILEITDRIFLEVEPDLWAWLANRNLDETHPASSIIANVREHIQGPLCEYLNGSDVEKPATVRVSLVDGKVELRTIPL